MSEHIVRVSRQNGGVQIWISVENLCDLAQRHPENPLRIVDTDKFVEEYIHELQEYAQSNDVETGCSHLEWLIEECIQNIYEGGSDNVVALNDEEL